MHDQLDADVSAVLLEYIYAEHGKHILRLEPEAVIWKSYSKHNRGEAISAKALSNICERYMTTSKVHTLRHTFAVGMVREGAPITDLANRLGHTDIRITQTYTKEIMGAENPYSEKLSKRFGITRKHK